MIRTPVHLFGVYCDPKELSLQGKNDREFFINYLTKYSFAYTITITIRERLQIFNGKKNRKYVKAGEGPGGPRHFTVDRKSQADFLLPLCRYVGGEPWLLIGCYCATMRQCQRITPTHYYAREKRPAFTINSLFTSCFMERLRKSCWPHCFQIKPRSYGHKNRAIYKENIY